jgi:putative MFS transporter
VAPDAVEIEARLERLPLTTLHVVILAASGFVFGIDLAELAMGQALSAVFSAGPKPLAAGELSFLLAAVYLGAVVGAPVMGWIADRRGAKAALVIVILWLGATSMFAAVSPTIGLLTAARLLSGLALGAYPPLFIVYLSDICPPGRRVSLIFFACALAYAAPPATIFAIRALTHAPAFGVAAWRWPLAAAGVICLAGGVCSLAMPEAPRWLASKGRHAAASAVIDRFEQSLVVWRPKALPANYPISFGRNAALTPAAHRRRLAFVSLLYFLAPFSTVAFPLITGPILLARGYNLNDTLLFVGLANVGPMVGALFAGLVIDRLRRSVALAVWGILMLIALAVFFLAPSVPAQMLAVVSFGILTAIYLPTLTAYGTEVFAVPVRARSASLAWSVNRTGATIAPILLLPLARSGQLSGVAIVLAGALSASILLVLVRPPQAA